MTPEAQKPVVARARPAWAEPGLAARAVALELIEAALARRDGLEGALSRPAFVALDPRDRGFARALAMTTLRRLGQIERRLAPRLDKPPPERVRQILRLGAAQLFWMDTPAHAAVSATVELAATRSDTRAFKGLVNAVLRGLARDSPPPDDSEALAPPWLFARWRATYGEADARAMAALIAVEPAADLTPKRNEEARELAAELGAVLLPGPTLRTTRHGEVAAWPGYAEGRWWVQDASSAVAARLFHVEQDQHLIDLCAAPGGKTLQLCAGGARVTALDRSALRLKRLEQNLARMGFEAEAVAVDAAEWDDPRQFDAVLLDAPCTSTGAFRRHPDALWTTRPSDLSGLTQTQARLLASAADRVRPGGRLVYCVCSLEPEEGEARVETFLRERDDFRLDPILPGEGGSPEASATSRGWLRILPHHREGGTDGFFAARLVRLPG